MRCGALQRGFETSLARSNHPGRLAREATLGGRADKRASGHAIQGAGRRHRGSTDDVGDIDGHGAVVLSDRRRSSAEDYQAPYTCRLGVLSCARRGSGDSHTWHAVLRLGVPPMPSSSPQLLSLLYRIEVLVVREGSRIEMMYRRESTQRT